MHGRRLAHRPADPPLANQTIVKLSCNRHSIRAAVVACALALPAGRGVAQATDRAVTFDRTGSVAVITPAFAARMGLRPPGWRVQGDYKEVKAFAVDTAGYVLAILRTDGTIERMPITTDQFESLRLEVETRLGVMGRPGVMPLTFDTLPRMPVAAPGAGAPAAAPAGVSTPPVTTPAYASSASSPSQSAGSDFARNQVVLAALVYGPLGAALVDDPAPAAALYLATVASTYFATIKPARDGMFSNAQNRLATGFGVGGGMAGAALAYSLGLASPDRKLTSDKATLGFALAGSLAGAVAGTVLGKPMTDAEAEGSTFGAAAGSIVAMGLLASARGEPVKSDQRLIGGTVLLGLAAGATLGHWYVERAAYTVTMGDVTSLATTGFIGTLAGLAIARPSSSSSVSVGAGLAVAGLIGGFAAGDWFFVRRFDLTEHDSWTLLGGTFAGGAILTAPFLLGNNTDSGVLFGAAAVGSLIGAWGVTSLSNFAPGTLKGAAGTKGGMAQRPAERDVEFMPINAAFAAAGIQGRFPLVHVRF